MKNTSLDLRVVHIVSVLFALCSVQHSVIAQGVNPGYGEKLIFRGLSGVTLNGTTQSWTIQDSGTVQQHSAPISISLPLSNRILISISSAAATAKFDTSNIQGITDTRLSFSYVFPGDEFWFVSGFSYPTGKTKLTSQEIQISTLLSQTAFGYKVPVFGQGIVGNAGLTYAASITRRFVMGLGINYIYKGNYEPVLSTASTIDYNPGDEVSGNIGADYLTFSKKFRFSIDISGSYFFQDKLNGSIIFQSGPRILGFLVASMRTESMNHTLQLRARVRGENSYYTNGVAKKYKSAIQVEAQYGIQKSLASWVIGTFIAEVKNYTEDQVPVGATIITTGKAFLGAAGIDMLFPFSNIILPTVTVKYNQGELTLENKPKNVTGFEAGLNLKIAF